MACCIVSIQQKQKRNMHKSSEASIYKQVQRVSEEARVAMRKQALLYPVYPLVGVVGQELIVISLRGIILTNSLAVRTGLVQRSRASEYDCASASSTGCPPGGSCCRFMPELHDCAELTACLKSADGSFGLHSERASDAAGFHDAKQPRVRVRVVLFASIDCGR